MYGLRRHCTGECVVYHFRYVFAKRTSGEKMNAANEIKPLIKRYIERLNKQYQTDRSREHSHRGSLEELVTSLIPSDFTVTNEPAHIDCGAPDYVITDNNKAPIAFIEAKDIGDTDLDGKATHKEQFDRYKDALSSVIFTDYLDFHLYQKGEFCESVRIAELRGGKIVSTKNDEKFAALMDVFLTQNNQPITSSTALARYMAHKARFLAKTVEECFNRDKGKEKQSKWYLLLESFRRALISDLSAQGFADMYAQTIAYGLFVARLNDRSPNNFSRLEACNLIPSSNPLLRSFFQTIGAFDIDSRIEWIIDDLANLFLRVDVKQLEMNYHNKNESDPFFHFYEEFLAEYDPELRKAKGVWYTPQPVVSFIVKSIDRLLSSEFDILRGLADSSKVTVKRKTTLKDRRGMKYIDTEYHRVQIFDPAVGSGTFLVEVLKQIYDKFRDQQGLWNSYVDEHLIQRINGFELLMAPYVIAHLKFSSFLKETGYELTGSKHYQRVNIFLTNSLEPYQDEVQGLFMYALNQEAAEANDVKENKPIMVMLGNPPYNASSQNKNSYIERLMIDYKQEPNIKQSKDEATLKEKNAKWLNDDYVKFIRIAQEYITKGKYNDGLIGFITPHGFIDNPTFRGMRYNLLKAFDKLYVLNLHGNAKKNERAPDGSKDENVFDIQQGVAISFFIRKTSVDERSRKLGQVYYADLYGLRKTKYEFLNSKTVLDVDFKKVQNLKPHYFFCPKELDSESEYLSSKFFGIDEVFGVNSVGFVSARDKLCIQSNQQKLIEVLEHFSTLGTEEAREYYGLKKDVRDWKVANAQNDINKHRLSDGSLDRQLIQSVWYRPFDKKFTFYSGEGRGFICNPRYQVMQHLISHQNLALCLVKVVKASEKYHHVFVSNAPIDSCFVSNKTSEITYAFPLFTYVNGIQLSNLNPKILKKIDKSYDPDEHKAIIALSYKLFYYIYGILHSNRYRSKYESFLKIGFPRIPFPKNSNEFELISGLGEELCKLHLLSNKDLDHGITYPEQGNNTVENISYNDNKIFINKAQYFRGVSKDAWNFWVGAYQPLQKWLKDRKNQSLNYNDIVHYQSMIIAITRTLEIMKRIDQVIEL